MDWQKIIMSWNHIMITKMTVFSRSLTSTQFSACPRSSYFLWKSTSKIKLEKSQTWKLNSFGFKESLFLIDRISEKLSKIDTITEKFINLEEKHQDLFLLTASDAFYTPQYETYTLLWKLGYLSWAGRGTCTSDRLQQSQPCTHRKCSGSRNGDFA